MALVFAAAFSGDPKKQIPDCKEEWELRMFWERNFYPNYGMVINDMYSKGLLEAGEYGIAIDW